MALRFSRSRMGRFTLILVAAWMVRVLLLPQSTLQVLPVVVQFALNLLTVLLAVPLVYYLWRFIAVVRRRFLWKIRRRLIVAHILIAAIPVLLMAVILYVAGLLFFYQLSYYLVEKQIGIHTSQIQAFNLSLSSEIQQVMSGPRTNPAAVKPFLDRDIRFLLSMYRTASIVLSTKDPATGKELVYAAGNFQSDPAGYQVPLWAVDAGGTSGLVFEDVQPELYQTQNPARGRHGRLYLRSLVLGEFRPDLPFMVEVSVPFDGDMLERLRGALGQDMLLADNIPNTGLSVMLQDTQVLGRHLLYATSGLDAAQQSMGRQMWSMPLYPTSWATGDPPGKADTEVLFMELSTSKLIQNVFHAESQVSQTILGALELVVGFFVAVELVSLVGGILLTKSITNAVYNLDRGTEFIRRGDFSHRINVKSDDQLAALAKSFNQMTEYIQTLVKERVQKERLERELEIAKEVQEQLFPKYAPKMNKMDLVGMCLPARVVSGDYYDFLQFDEKSVGIALGDICGKGISAALLMANLQATLRSNVMARGNDLDHDASGNAATARVVKVLNDQISHFTSANKFASFFYAVYDENHSQLTYCNAGHNPPLFFCKEGFQRLTTGGTVVGIFPDAEYDQETIGLSSGDILLAYTDGITESVNEYGEEFGEQRLIDLIYRNRDLPAAYLQKAIVEEVLAWAYEEERDDDMTLIVARCR